MAFMSPIPNPPAWTLTRAELLALPLGLRYSGCALRAVQATRGTVANIVAPFPAVVRTGALPTGEQVLELQALTTRMPAAFRSLRLGAPTLYVALNGSTASVDEHGFAESGATIASVQDATFALAWQERTSLEPVAAAQLIQDAINAGGEEGASWGAFVQRLVAQIGGAADAPLALLDHAGNPLGSGGFRVIYRDAAGSQTATLDVDVAAADGGDLRAAVRRLHAANPVGFPVADLWAPLAANGTAVLRRTEAGVEPQFAGVDDGRLGASEIVVGPATRHVAVTDLHNWFAPPPATGSPPPRLRRGCKVTALVNGPEYFNDLFASLNAAAAGPSPAFMLSGWSMFPNEPLVDAPGGAAGFARSLKDASALITGAGGQCSFLPSEFLLIDDPEAVQVAEILLVFILVGGILTLSGLGLSFASTDAGGGILLMALLVVNSPFMIWLTTDEAAFEQNQRAVDELHAPPASTAVLDPYPATVDDNPIAPGEDDPIFASIFTASRHFGVFHQKIAAIRSGGQLIAYCGGIDLNPDRLDDERHLARDTPAGAPYHDVHARIEGPAARDVVHTFNERWAHATGGAAPAIPTPAEGAVPAAGDDIVQIARTYAQIADASRRLPYAPAGERGVLDTMLAAVSQAREFIYFEDQYFTPSKELRDALLAKVGSGEIKRLIAIIPGANDQIFGEVVRIRLIQDLMDADAGRGIVVIGAPRRRCGSAGSQLRSSSGRLRLAEDMPVAEDPPVGEATLGTKTILLTPRSRLPAPPFWVSVNGELMWAYDEDPTFLPAGVEVAPGEGPMRLMVERGSETRLLRGIGAPQGPSIRAHKKGAAATIVRLDDIYVHAKLMIVDDIFLGVGSANLNRRGFYHDGEAQAFTLPGALRWGARNPVAALRRKLWAEMLDLPLGMADALLRDPIASSELFRRSYFLGNRVVDALASPLHGMFGGVRGGDAMVGFIVQAVMGGAIMFQHGRLFDGVVDPTTGLDPDQEPTQEPQEPTP